MAGLTIDPLYPFMGATPDGLINCACCNTGVLEIKCPFRCKHKFFQEAATENSTRFFLQDINGTLALKEDHSYYYQVQMQMKLCHVQYCDFVVWRKNDIFIQRIQLNSAFIHEAFAKVEPFIRLAILPELVGRWYTKQTTCVTPSTSVEMIQVNNEDDSQPWCYCRRDASFDDMIGCDNADCPIEWFHLSCLHLTQQQVPQGKCKWYCPECHKTRKSKVRK